MKVLIVGSGGREHAIAWKSGSEPQSRQDLLRAGKCPESQSMQNVFLLQPWSLTSWLHLQKKTA